MTSEPEQSVRHQHSTSQDRVKRLAIFCNLAVFLAVPGFRFVFLLGAPWFWSIDSFISLLLQYLIAVIFNGLLLYLKSVSWATIVVGNIVIMNIIVAYELAWSGPGHISVQMWPTMMALPVVLIINCALGLYTIASRVGKTLGKDVE